MTESLLVLDWLGGPSESASVSVAAGEVVALLGANGAGKSTLLKTVMGLLPARGSIRFGGEPIAALNPARRARRGLGYVPEGRRLFPGMSVRDTLLVGCREGTRAAERRLDEILALFPALAPRRDTPAWQLSGGQQQMLAIGRALMSAPRLLLLDEPSLGLAPVVVDELLARVRDLAARGTAVLLAEQGVARALEIADRAYVLGLGRIIAEGTPDELRRGSVLQRAFLGADIALS
jgi:branched-chain amino acid transport system ATP-binding protein